MGRYLRPWSIWTAASGLVIVAYTLAIVISAPAGYLRFQSDIVYPIVPALVLAFCAIGPIRVSAGRAKVAWVAMALGVGAWLGADLFFSWYDLMLGRDPPFPGLPDLFYGIGYGAFAAAIPLVLFPAATLRDRRWMLDAAMIIIALAALSYAYVLVPVMDAGYTRGVVVVALFYPVADLALIAMIVIGIYSSAWRVSHQMTIIAASLLLLAIADSAYTWLVTTAGYENTGNPLDPLWLASYALMGLCALIPPEQEVRNTSSRRQSVVGLALPYAAVGALLALAVIAYLNDDTPVALMAAAAVTTALVILRQFLTLRENTILYRSLEKQNNALARSNAALHDSENRLRSVLNSAPVALFTVSAAGIVTLAEGSALAALNLRPEDVLGRHLAGLGPRSSEIVHGVERALLGESSSLVVSTGDLSFAVQCTPLRNNAGLVTEMIGVVTDVSERERFQEQLVKLAHHDDLTGLFNRRRFDEELERIVAESRRYDQPAAVIFVDIDQFKTVNDGFGHRAGDELLCAIAQTITSQVHATDVVARLGGDEFGVLLPRTASHDALIVARRIVSAIAEQHYTTSGSPARATATAGMAAFPTHGADARELLSRADIAMYRAKEEGRNRANPYDPSHDLATEQQSRSGWQRRIREALELERFTLHAQPVLDVVTRRVAHHELLLRLIDEDGRVVQPAAFLGTAERSGLITDIDCWVVKQAVQILASHSNTVSLSINLSARSLGDPRTLRILRHELSQQDIAPNRLTLEITETVALADIQRASAFVRDVKALGCEVSLDDFGVGFASLGHLKQLPVDELKIDGSFVRNLARDTVDRELVRIITSSGHALGKRVVAEFVSDEETLTLLASYGVDRAQGYYIGEPGPIDEVLVRAPLAA